MIPNPIDEPTISVPRAGAALGLSRGASYALARQGRLPGLIRVSERRVRVSTAALLRHLDIPVDSPSRAADD
jgi:predicted DNA-binding transcriptional regulator AlpA